MNAEQFVKAIRAQVADSVIESIPELLSNPPGRKPAKQLLDSSQWFKSLDDQSKKEVMLIVSRAVHDALFSFMCVLDGVSVIDKQHSEFQLFCVNSFSGASTQLSGSDENDSLHELYKALDP